MNITLPDVALFYEGPDDERFLKSIVMPRLKAKRSNVVSVPYSNTKKDTISKLITAYRAMQYDVVFLVDQDKIDAKKRKTIARKVFPCLNVDEIRLVKQEIEAWYLAGWPSDKWLARTGQAAPARTDSMDKADFARLCSNCNQTPLRLMLIILEGFSESAARQRNASLAQVLDL